MQNNYNAFIEKIRSDYLIAQNLKKLNHELLSNFYNSLKRLYIAYNIKKEVDNDLVKEFSDLIYYGGDNINKYDNFIETNDGQFFKILNSNLLKEHNDKLYFSHEDNKNLVDINSYIIEINTNSNIYKNAKLRFSDFENDSSILLDLFSNEIKMNIGEIEVFQILNYDKVNNKYSFNKKGDDIYDYFFDDLTGIVRIKAKVAGDAKFIIELKNENTIHEKTIDISVNEINDNYNGYKGDYNPKLFEDYLKKIIDNFEFKYDKKFNFSNVEEKITVLDKGINYKDGWRLNYNNKLPEVMKNKNWSNDLIFRKEFDIDSFSTDDQTVIDPFIIEDLKENNLRSEFDKKYLLEPKIVKVKKIKVNSEEERQFLIDEFNKNLNKSDGEDSYVSRITGLRYKEIIKEISNIKSDMVHTYGSELFGRIAEAINNDINLYRDSEEKW